MSASQPPGSGWQAALVRKALAIADEHFGYSERRPDVDVECKCSYCRYARVRRLMMPPPAAQSFAFDTPWTDALAAMRNAESTLPGPGMHPNCTDPCPICDREGPASTD